MTCSIVWFAEHDIDIWLAEELRTNTEFAAKFLSGAGVEVTTALVCQTRVSVINKSAEWIAMLDTVITISISITLSILVVQLGVQMWLDSAPALTRWS